MCVLKDELILVPMLEEEAITELDVETGDDVANGD
jgi:hypothetical protein